MGDRVAVMRRGVLQQVGAPQRLYERPVNLFVAEFIGSPAMNLVRGELDGETIRFAGHGVPLDARRRPRPGSPAQMILGIRPEDFQDARFSPPGLPTIDVEVALVEDLGPEALAFFALDAERVESDALGVTSQGADQEALMADDRRARFCATLDPATEARRGATCRLTVNPARFHFFSPYDGESLLAPAAELPQRLVEAI